MEWAYTVLQFPVMAFFVWRGDDIMLLWLDPVISSQWDQWIPSEHPNNGECDRFVKILSGGLCFDLTQIWSNYFQCSQYRPLNKSKFLGKEEGKWDKEERKKGGEERSGRTSAFLYFIAHWPHKPKLLYHSSQSSPPLPLSLSILTFL